LKVIHVSEIDGFTVGHADNHEFHTGCTVIMCPSGAPASVFIPGFAPGTRETQLLSPWNIVPAINALLFTGGSAFGLSAASGVVRFLLEQFVGFDAEDKLRIPIVPAAAIYDFYGNVSKGRYPDEGMGYEAAKNAVSGPLRSGPYGVGHSLSSGGLTTPPLQSPSGFGSYGLELANGLKLAAIVAVNPLGSVVNPNTGEIISGVRHSNGSLYNRIEILQALSLLPPAGSPVLETAHTVLAAVATNAKMSKLDAYRVARMGSSGIARAIFPSRLLFDGDIVFAMSSCTGKSFDPSFLGALAAEVVAQAIVRSVPGYHDMA
jgi:L-aminopeptidase/D-esterase-like protein